MRSKSLRVGGAALAAAAVFVLSAGVAQAKRRNYDPRLARNPLVLTSFVQKGRTDVRRNETLIFKFSALVKKRTADERSLRIASVTDGGVRPASGAMRVRGARIEFDPTRTQRNFDEARKKNVIGIEKDNPEGFESFLDYIVELPATPDLHTLKNVRGQRLLQAFDSTFRTNDLYDDVVTGQPRFVGDRGTGFLGFDPPRSGSTGLVDEDAIVVLEFSEPIDINSLDPASTVIVERLGVGPVPGFIQKDPNEPSGRRFFFVPSLGFGSNEVNQSGWDIRVTLFDRIRDDEGVIIAPGITDLAGNPLKRPVQFSPFKTRFVEGKPSSSILVEAFDNQSKMDAETLVQGGEWDTVESSSLRGGTATTYPDVEIQYTTANTGQTVVRTRVAEPLVSAVVPPSGGGGCTSVPQGSRAQMLYTSTDLGIEAAITDVAWGPSSNALFAANHDDVLLRMGHTSFAGLGTDFSGNVNIGNLQQVYRGEYTIPQAKNIDPTGALDTKYWRWPSLTSVFEYDGINNVVFDASVPGGTNCQILRIGFIPAGGAFPNRRAVSRKAASQTADFVVDTVVYDIAFTKRRRTTRAISLWYESAADAPLFAQPIISPVGQPGGVGLIVELEGAHGKPDPFTPGKFVADPSTATGWTKFATEIDGHRFVRFRIQMIANLSTNQTARVNSFQLPYQF